MEEEDHFDVNVLYSYRRGLSAYAAHQFQRGGVSSSFDKLRHLRSSSAFFMMSRSGFYLGCVQTARKPCLTLANYMPDLVDVVVV